MEATEPMWLQPDAWPNDSSTWTDSGSLTWHGTLARSELGDGCNDSDGSDVQQAANTA